MISKKKVAVITAGCGHQDGTEITEAICLILSLELAGAQVQGFAPNLTFNEVNHMTGKPTGQQRNSLIEAARIFRGNVQDISQLSASDYDALAFAGGSGAITILSDWKEKKSHCTVNPFVESAIQSFYEQSKPIAAMCIAPVLIGKVLHKKKPTLTVGAKSNVSEELHKLGCEIEVCPADDFITDRDHKIITTPAFMYDTTASEVFKGISGLAKELVEMA